MVTPTYLPKIGGIENHIKELSQNLLNNGNEVEILVIGKGFKIHSELIEGIKTHYINANGIKPFIFFNHLSNYINIDSFDIVHVHEPHIAGISIHFYLYNYGKKLVLSSHGGIFHTKNNNILKKIYWYTIAKVLIKKYSRVICVSKNDVKYYKKIYNNITVIENGINIDKFKSIRDTINYNKKSFIYFGRFSENKDIITLIKNIKNIINKKGYEDTQLTLIGKAENSKYKSKIYKEIKGYEKNIKIFNFLSEKELLEKISEATFFITTTKYEGFGISVFEALAAGRICIVNNISPLNKMFENEKELYFIDFNDAESFVQIMNIIHQSKKFDNIRKNAFETLKRFSWNRKINEIEHLYKEILND